MVYYEEKGVSFSYALGIPVVRHASLLANGSGYYKRKYEKQTITGNLQMKRRPKSSAVASSWLITLLHFVPGANEKLRDIRKRLRYTSKRFLKKISVFEKFTKNVYIFIKIYYFLL